MAVYFPSDSAMVQNPPSGQPEILPFLAMDDLTTPMTQSLFWLASTSQEWHPEVKPLDPSTNTKWSKRSGLSGSCTIVPALETLVRSLLRDKQGYAVLGSKVTRAKWWKKRWDETSFVRHCIVRLHECDTHCVPPSSAFSPTLWISESWCALPRWSETPEQFLVRETLSQLCKGSRRFTFLSCKYTNLKVYTYLFLTIL